MAKWFRAYDGSVYDISKLLNEYPNKKLEEDCIVDDDPYVDLGEDCFNDDFEEKKMKFLDNLYRRYYTNG